MGQLLYNLPHHFWNTAPPRRTTCKVHSSLPHHVAASHAMSAPPRRTTVPHHLQSALHLAAPLAKCATPRRTTSGTQLQLAASLGKLRSTSPQHFWNTAPARRTTWKTALYLTATLLEHCSSSPQHLGICAPPRRNTCGGQPQLAATLATCKIRPTSPQHLRDAIQHVQKAFRLTMTLAKCVPSRPVDFTRQSSIEVEAQMFQLQCSRLSRISCRDIYSVDFLPRRDNTLPNVLSRI